MNNAKAQLIVALDVDRFEEARHLVDQLKDVVDIFKVGSQLFTACGPVVVRYIHGLGKKVFLDLKYHDIPNTVGNALKSAVGLGVSVYDKVGKGEKVPTNSPPLLMCTLHIVGGEEMMVKSVAEAKKHAQSLGLRAPLIVGITVLTSDAKQDNIRKVVLDRAKLAHHCGLDGIVASSQEAALVRKELGDDFVIVTPGIRLEGEEVGDQKRVTTPKDAVSNGSNFLVVGRPIVKAQNPLSAAKQILEQMNL